MARGAAACPQDRVRAQFIAQLAQSMRPIGQVHTVQTQGFDQFDMGVDDQRNVAGMGNLAHQIGAAADATLVPAGQIQPQTGNVSDIKNVL
jgi:hypothetical protein